MLGYIKELYELVLFMLHKFISLLHKIWIFPDACIRIIYDYYNLKTYKLSNITFELKSNNILRCVIYNNVLFLQLSSNAILSYNIENHNYFIYNVSSHEPFVSTVNGRWIYLCKTIKNNYIIEKVFRDGYQLHTSTYICKLLYKPTYISCMGARVFAITQEKEQEYLESYPGKKIYNIKNTFSINYPVLGLVSNDKMLVIATMYDINVYNNKLRLIASEHNSKNIICALCLHDIPSPGARREDTYLYVLTRHDSNMYIYHYNINSVSLTLINYFMVDNDVISHIILFSNDIILFNNKNKILRYKI